MGTAIHSWESFSEGVNSKVELYYDHVLVIRNNNLEKAIRHSLEQVLLSTYCIGDTLQIDFELLEYIISLTLPEEFSPKAALVYHFYKAFDVKKIKAESYEHNPKSSDFAHYYRCITTYGLRQYYETRDGAWEQSKQRFHHFLLQGPLMSRIPLEMRKRWQEMVWNALGVNSLITLEASFAIFDYSKIEEKKYQVETGTHQGEFIEIHKDHIMIGGFDGRDGGAIEYSIEYVWNNEYLISDTLEEYKSEIYKNLEQAIVAGNRIRKEVKNISTNKEQLSPPENPGEAPPA